MTERISLPKRHQKTSSAEISVKNNASPSPNSASNKTWKWKAKVAEREKGKLARDILISEERYCLVLSALSEGFAIPLLAPKSVSAMSANSGGATSQSSTGALDDARISIFLTSLSQIATLHNELLSELKLKVSSITSEQMRKKEEKEEPSSTEQFILGDLFSKYSSISKCYERYSANFHAASQIMFGENTALVSSKINSNAGTQFVSELVELLMDSPKWRSVVGQQATVQSMLMKPIERFGEYILIVDKLLKVVSEEDPDFEALSSARAEIVAADQVLKMAIDSKKRDMMDKLIKLDMQFTKRDVDLYAPDRQLLREGKLNKVLRNVPKQFIFHLFSDMLIYSSESGDGTLNFCGRVDLSRCIVKDIPDSWKRRNAFQIVTIDKSFVVFATSPELKQGWMDDINKCLDNLAETKKSRALKTSSLLSFMGSGVVVNASKPSHKRGPSLNPENSRKSSIDSTSSSTTAASNQPPEESKNAKTVNQPTYSTAVSSEKIDLLPASSSRCALCNLQFGILNSKKHCSVCGEYICASCAMKKIDHVSGNPRICDRCFEDVSKLNQFKERVSSERDSKDSIHEEDYDENQNSLWSASQDDPRVRIFQEIIQTEQSYVEDLQMLLEVFCSPLLDSCIVATAKSMQTVKVDLYKLSLPMSCFKGNFVSFLSQVDLLFSLNSELLECLESRAEIWKKKDCIGDVFLQFAALFRIYGDYAQEHSKAVSIFFLDLFAEFTKKSEAVSSLKGKYLSSLLISPIQRIPRYELLLKEILKSTPQDHVDKPKIKKALDEINKSAVFINEAIRANETRQKLVELEHQFTSQIHLAHHSRRLIRSGELTIIRTLQKPKKFYCHLFNDLLLLSSKNKEKFQHEATISLGAVVVSSESDQKKYPNSIKLSGKQETFIAQMDSKEQMDEWLALLKGCLNDIADQLVEHAIDPDEDFEEEEFVLPVWKTNDERNACSRCEKSFGLMLRRHHCRACGDIFCDACTEKKALICKIDPVNPQRVCEVCYQMMLSRIAPDRARLDILGSKDCDNDSNASDKFSVSMFRTQKLEAKELKREVVAEKKDFGNLRSMFEKIQPASDVAPMNPSDLPSLKISNQSINVPQPSSRGNTIQNKLDEANRRREFSEASGRVIWMNDSDRDSCAICDNEFSLFNRRHHCRQCGMLICNDCSLTKDSLRICATCDDQAKNSVGSSAAVKPPTVRTSVQAKSAK